MKRFSDTVVAIVWFDLRIASEYNSNLQKLLISEVAATLIQLPYKSDYCKNKCSNFNFRIYSIFFQTFDGNQKTVMEILVQNQIHSLPKEFAVSFKNILRTYLTF